jgi:hypothetical protein
VRLKAELRGGGEGDLRPAEDPQQVEDLMVFSCFGIGGVYQNPDEKKGGFSRPSKF